MLIDSHCHLNMFNEKDILNLSSFMKIDKELLNINNIINNAYNNDVKIINNIATHIEEFDSVINIANKYKNVFASIGVHPENVNNSTLTLDLLLNYLKKNKVIGIGETGLDYHTDSFDKKKQQKSFEIHIEASRMTGLPIIIHTRDSDDDTLKILKSEMKNGKFKFLIHCFWSNKQNCFSYLDLGAYISVSGAITFKKSDDLREAIKIVPLDKMLIETDSPFLAPTPYRGKINQPSYVKNTLQYLVDFLKIDFNILAKKTTANFLRLFNKIKCEDK